MKLGGVIKRCSVCGRFLGENAFFHHNRMKGHKMSFCKKCCRNKRILWEEGKGIFRTGKPGRKKGYTVSSETKRKISKAKLGSFQSCATKDKISKSVLAYFREKNSLSKEMAYVYKSCGEWINANQIEIDSFDDVKTLSRLRTINYMEIPASHFIEQIAIDDLDPEKLLLIKEKLKEMHKLKEEEL